MKKLRKLVLMILVVTLSLSSFSFVGMQLNATEKYYTKEEMELKLNRMRNLDTSQELELLSTLDDDVIIVETSAMHKSDYTLSLDDLDEEQNKIVDEVNEYLYNNNIIPSQDTEIMYKDMIISVDDTYSVILTTPEFKVYLSEVAYFDVLETSDEQEAKSNLKYWKTRYWSTKDKIYVAMKVLVQTGVSVLSYNVPFIGKITSAAGLYNIWTPGTYTRTTYFKDVYQVYTYCSNNGAGIKTRTGYTNSSRTIRVAKPHKYSFSSDSYRC